MPKDSSKWMAIHPESPQRTAHGVPQLKRIFLLRHDSKNRRSKSNQVHSAENTHMKRFGGKQDINVERFVSESRIWVKMSYPFSQKMG